MLHPLDSKSSSHSLDVRRVRQVFANALRTVIKACELVFLVASIALAAGLHLLSYQPLYNTRKTVSQRTHRPTCDLLMHG